MAANLPTSLNFPQYRDLVKKLKQGKSLPTAIYLHKSSLAEATPAELLSFITNTVNKHLQRRWHGAAIFPFIIKLGGRLELR